MDEGRSAAGEKRSGTIVSRPEMGPRTIASLPNELLTQIFRLLSLDDFVRVGAVSRRWRDVSQQALRVYGRPLGPAPSPENNCLVIGAGVRWNPLYVKKYLAPQIDTIAFQVSCGRRLTMVENGQEFRL